IGLLRADMKRHAIGLEAEFASLVQEIDGHLRRAAELARQRPFGAVAIDQDAAEDARAGSGAAELLQLARAVEGEEADALLVGIGDVALLLHGVAERHPLAGRPLGEAKLDLG